MHLDYLCKYNTYKIQRHFNNGKVFEPLKQIYYQNLIDIIISVLVILYQNSPVLQANDNFSSSFINSS
jgi:hypothetical protein